MKKFKRLKRFVGHNWQEIVLGFFVLLFLAFSCTYLMYTQDFSSDPVTKPDFVKWGSPDETANYIFTKLYAQEGRIYLEEDYNKLVDDIMRPRSFRSDNGVMKPVSFLGIILIYGKIASLFSYKVIPFLTPIMASIGVVFYYLLVRRLFGKNNAFISSLVMLTFPPFVYYTVRSMFHNVLFTVLLIMGLYFVYLMGANERIKKLKDYKKFKYNRVFLFAALAGIFFGLTVITRTSELLWLFPMLVVLWLFNIRRAGFLKLAVFIIFFLVAMSPMFYYNQKLYGSYFYGGYPQMNESIHTLARASTDIVSSSVSGRWLYIKEALKTIKNTIFHFGYDGEQSKNMFLAYFKNMFPWLYWPAVFGLLYFLVSFRDQKLKRWAYLLSYLLISFLLVIYYGSWVFHDNPDAEAVTIGNSYTRYWLPVYLGAIPFMSLLIIKITKMFCLIIRGKIRDNEDDYDEAGDESQISIPFSSNEKNYCCNILRLMIITLLAFVSLKFLLYGSEEGLIKTAQNQIKTKAEWEQLINLTETNSVVITRYHDKIFFPERKVIVGLFDDLEMNDRYSRLADELPLYYYNFSFSEDDIEYLNSRRLAEADLNIALVKEINDDFSLYKLTKSEKTLEKYEEENRD